MENLRGAALMTFAMVCFALEDMFVKLLTLAGIPSGEVLALMGLGGGLVFAMAALWRGDRLLSRDVLHPSVMGRNLGEVVGTVAFILALAFTPLATASAILQATPLAVTLGAALFLGEAVGWRRWLAIGVGFFGVLVVIDPFGQQFDPLSILAVIAVIGLAGRDIITRRVPKTISSMQLSAYGFLAVAPAGLAMAAVMHEPLVSPALPHWLWIAGGIFFGVLGYYSLIAAMRIGEASFITPFRYTRLLMAAVISALVFGEPATANTILGGAIIVASGLYTLWRERMRARG